MTVILKDKLRPKFIINKSKMIFAKITKLKMA